MKNFIKIFILPLFLVIELLFVSFNEAMGQSSKMDIDKSQDTLVIGKKYDGKLSAEAIKRIDEAMERIKSEFETMVVAGGRENVRYFDIIFITDVNKLKSIELRPQLISAPFSSDKMYDVLLDFLKKYLYIDIMVTGYSTGTKNNGVLIANTFATYLYEKGIPRSRLRVNGLLLKDDGIYFNMFVFLVPSKEMIDKAIKGEL